jgi:16S rRNA (cytosine1402-N4)-methyltransferase
MSDYHTSVLLKETIAELKVREGSKYIDGTIGGGGHTLEILKHGGLVLGIDVDEDALAQVEIELRKRDHTAPDKLTLVKGNFKDIDKIAANYGFERVAGILLDLGVSSHHFDSPDRGFSFQYEGPLDMRMDKELQIDASDLVNVLSKSELSDLFFKLGEERFSRQIATHIIEFRREKRIETTNELTSIIRKSVSFSKKGINPATKVFQALRIAVNDELNNLIEVLPKAVKLLESGGELAVISFHSLEDRIVKRTFLDFEHKGLGKIVTKKPIVPTEEEIRLNSRSRSSKLRIFEKI